MNVDSKELLLYAITNRKGQSINDLCRDVELALKAGVTFLQVREKNQPTEIVVKVAKALKPICSRYGVPLIINDDVDAALIVDVDGVHIGQNDGNAIEIRKKIGMNKILGITANNVAQAIVAEKNGADYIGSGSVFSTNTKEDVDILDHLELKAICETVKIPVVAIGGITKTNIKELANLKISGISVISAIFGAKDIAKATYELKNEISLIVGDKNE